MLLASKNHQNKTSAALRLIFLFSLCLLCHEVSVWISATHTHTHTHTKSRWDYEALRHPGAIRWEQPEEKSFLLRVVGAAERCPTEGERKSRMWKDELLGETLVRGKFQERIKRNFSLQIDTCSCCMFRSACSRSLRSAVKNQSVQSEKWLLWTVHYILKLSRFISGLPWLKLWVKRTRGNFKGQLKYEGP